MSNIKDNYENTVYPFSSYLSHNLLYEKKELKGYPRFTPPT